MRSIERRAVDPDDMLLELMRDNKAVVHTMREAHEVADKYDDVGTAVRGSSRSRRERSRPWRPVVYPRLPRTERRSRRGRLLRSPVSKSEHLA
jgi:hypothetical protein